MSKPEKVRAVQPSDIVTLTAQDLNLQKSEKKVSHVGFSLWSRVLLQNWRQGTVSVKGRSEVSCSNKKPWKQKGTGRARAGSARSPIWRGGGVTFGPQERTKTLKISKKLKKRVLGDVLLDYINNGKIISANWGLQGDIPRTAQAYALLKDSGLVGKKINLFLSMNDSLTYASFANIPSVRILFYDQTNAFDFVNGHYCLFLKKDEEHFKQMVSKWS